VQGHCVRRRERLSLPPSHPRSRLGRVIRGKGDSFEDRGLLMPCAICEHVRAANIRLLRSGGGNGWRERGTTISIWPAECHSHPFDRYTADRQPTSARGNNESAATGEARGGEVGLLRCISRTDGGLEVRGNRTFRESHKFRKRRGGSAMRRGINRYSSPYRVTGTVSHVPSPAPHAHYSVSQDIRCLPRGK